MSHVTSTDLIDRASEIVTLENVTKIYESGSRAVCALRNVSLAVNSGVFLAVMGEDRPGKTTLLKCLSGEIQPSSGGVRHGTPEARGTVVEWLGADGTGPGEETLPGRHPRLLLVDEGGEEVGAALRRAVQRPGVAAVMTTTEPAAAACADAVVFLHGGAVVDMVADAGPDRISECLERSARLGPC
ncbi:ATP-binding cassette domain-containing protein [Streptomyces sp. MST-110588]|uniref:ATP-binding cassette domain-containing protein n=1 Tax=Streptomyces sp. MST-110588 TaxID=2833628 RepID=UPI001F5D80DB|nr:ATP-binding cassette domain-containing protein [Streptomyces sp. MST-110588]UNO41469.1 ATP-binding cassette domain-containing protein [Streptomyces sp. MST-110588]